MPTVRDRNVRKLRKMKQKAKLKARAGKPVLEEGKLMIFTLVVEWLACYTATYNY